MSSPCVSFPFPNALLNGIGLSQVFERVGKGSFLFLLFLSLGRSLGWLRGGRGVVCDGLGLVVTRSDLALAGFCPGGS